jgi:hypothetical protein
MKAEEKRPRRVPAWVVAYLGMEVVLIKSHSDGSRFYPTGSLGRLESIQSGRRSAYATVVLHDDVTQAEENFQFSSIRPG